MWGFLAGFAMFVAGVAFERNKYKSKTDSGEKTHALIQVNPGDKITVPVGATVIFTPSPGYTFASKIEVGDGSVLKATVDGGPTLDALKSGTSTLVSTQFAWNDPSAKGISATVTVA